MTFRQRILVAMLPLFALLVALGGTGAALIYHLGGQIDLILRENYDSVIYMRDLNEALERIDSSFQFALAGREEQSRQQYQDQWKFFDESLDKEQHNITILPEEGRPGREADHAERATIAAGATTSSPTRRRIAIALYFGQGKKPGLYGMFLQIKKVSGRIPANQPGATWRRPTSSRAGLAALHSLVWYGGGLAFGIALAVLLVAGTIRTILYPDPGGHRIGRGHRGGQPRPTRAHHLRR